MHQKNSITLKELQVQIGLGLLGSINKIATFIKKEVDDVEILTWAYYHTSVKMRSAAIENVNLPIGLFIRAGLFARTGGERFSYLDTLNKRKNEIEDALKVVTDYPQLSLIFKDATSA